MTSLFLIKNKYNFLVLGFEKKNNMMLCGGTKLDEDSFKAFLYKFFIHSTSIYDGFDFLKEIDECYIYDNIQATRITVAANINLNAWNMDNYSSTSEQLFKFITHSYNNHEYHFVDISTL